MPSSIALALLAAVPYAMAAPPVKTPAQIANEPIAKEENAKVMRYTAWTWVAIVSAMLIYRWGLVLLRHIRRLSNLNHGTSSDSKQRYFSVPDDTYSKVKRDLITAPLWKKRHNREFKLSAAANMGVLPGRLQFLFLIGYLAMQIAFCCITIEWSNPELWYDDARNRTGVLSVMNMIPLFLLAGRNNPLIFFLGLSFDTYNLIHRWLGRIVVLEAVAHTAIWMGAKTYEKGWDGGWAVIEISLGSSQLIQTGMVGTAAFILLLLLSPSVIRHAWYETFLGIHFLLAVAAVVGVWMHCEGMREQGYVMAAAVCWFVERAWRFMTIIRRNTGNGGTKAEVEALPGDAVRITLRVAKPWKFTPGAHVYLYMPSIGGITSHPFSLAWSEEEEDWSTEKALPVSRQDAFGTRRTNMSLIIRRRTGFTDSLFSSVPIIRHARRLSIRACTEIGAAGSAPQLNQISELKDALWRFLRPHTIRGTALGSVALVARALIENSNLIKWSLLFKAFSGLIALICGNGYIVGINQIYDIGIDKVNKPYLPIAAGDLSVQSAWLLVLLFAASGLLIVGLNFGPFITSLYCLGLFLGSIYSVPPFRLKRYPVAAFLIIATVRGFLLNFGVYHATRAALGLTFEWSSAVAFITIFVTLFALVIAITKDLPDVEGDRKFQISTLATKLGVRNIAFLGSGLLLANYLGAIFAALYMPQDFRSTLMIPAHTILALGLIFQTWVLEQANYTKEAISNFYRFIWNLFYAEYIIFPFI